MLTRSDIIRGLAGAILLAGTVFGGGLLPFTRNDAPAESPQSETERKSFFSSRAKENFLRLSRKDSYSLPEKSLAAGDVDTIGILAVRVDFAVENPDDIRTTGNGRFDIRDTATFLAQAGHALDPSPHNRDYFMAHLRALARYWETVANGKIYFEYEVWPPATDSAYHLDSNLAYYGSQPPNFGLGEFFHDALRAAHSVDSANISFRDPRGRKKAIILFHAGSDQQTNLYFSDSNSVYDLFTGFATFDADNWLVLGADTIVEGTIMPETMSQDRRVTCMNAVMAHEFGHQLGLIDIYNTGANPFITEVGDFELMDHNGMNTGALFPNYGTQAFGTVPVFPSAWSRAYLGFDAVVEYREGTGIELAAVKMRTENTKIVKIPISATEYYLLENRRSDVDGQVEGLQQDSSTNVILGPVRRDLINGGLIPLPEYDLYLPAGSSGIAVWHIDEKAAVMDYFPFDGFTNNFDANTVQWDRSRRFMRLVEADGLINFGGNYYSGFGLPTDLFYNGNNSRFDNFSNPPAISNDGAYTHIRISNISTPAMVMRFDITQERMANGFPRRVGIPSNPHLPPTAADLDGDSVPEILAVSKSSIFAVRADGRGFIDSLDEWNDYDTLISVIRSSTAANPGRPLDTTLVSMPLFADAVAQITTRPVVATFNDTTTLVLVGTANGVIFEYLTTPNSSGIPAIYRAQTFKLRRSNGGEVRAIMTDTVHSLVHAIYEDGSWVPAPWDTSGILNDAIQFNATPVGVCRYNAGMAYLVERSGASMLYQMRDTTYSFPFNPLVVDSVEISEIGLHPPIATDLDRDGHDEIILLSHTGHLISYTFAINSIVSYDAIDLETRDTAAAGPTVADINNDGFAEILVPGTNRIYAYARNGLYVNDYPLTIDAGHPGQVVITEPIVTDIDGNGSLDILAATYDSLVYFKTVQVIYIDSITNPGEYIVRDSALVYGYYNYYSRLHAISPGQFRINGFPLPVGAIGMSSLEDTIVGVTPPVHLQNGTDGLLAVTGADGWLNVWRMGWRTDSASWPMAGGAPDGSAYLSLAALGAENPMAEFLPESRFFGYPNPATGSATTIRFYLSKPAAVELTAYDALGDKVWESKIEVSSGNSTNDVAWSLDGISSGIYHCRLKATALSGGEEAVVFKTIAVVK